MTEEKVEKNVKELVVFLDTIGRTIIAKKHEENDDKLIVENPAVVNIIPQQVQDPNTGQPVQRMALQLFPLFFREFLAEKDQPVKFAYNKSTIAMSHGDNIALDYKVGIQYEQLFTSVGEVSVTPTENTVGETKIKTPNVEAPATENKDNVIKLFDD